MEEEVKMRTPPAPLCFLQVLHLRDLDIAQVLCLQHIRGGSTRSSFSKAVENALPLLVAMLVNQAAVQGVEHVVCAFEVEEERIEVWQQEAALEKRGTTVTIKDIGIGNEQRGCEG